MLTNEQIQTTTQQYNLNPQYYDDIIQRINGMPDKLIQISGITKQQVLADNRILTMMWLRYQKFMDEEAQGWGLKKKEQAFKTTCEDVLAIPFTEFEKLWNKTEQTYIDLAALIRITEDFNEYLYSTLRNLYGKSDRLAKSAKVMADRARDIRYSLDEYLERNLPDANLLDWNTAFTGPLASTDPSPIEKAIIDRINEILKISP